MSLRAQRSNLWAAKSRKCRIRGRAYLFILSIARRIGLNAQSRWLHVTFANGAGAGAQEAIGTAVLGGVITSTFLVTLFAPLFYVMIQKTFGRRKLQQAAQIAKPK